MKKILILITLLIICCEASAKCTYSGSTRRQTLSLKNIKIPTDTSIPVGSVLYTQKFGTQTYKNFECDKSTDDQYIIDVGAAPLPVSPESKVVLYMKLGLMALDSRYPISCVVKTERWSLQKRGLL